MTGEWTNRFPNLVRLRRGDVVLAWGRRQVVVLVSDCCARVLPEDPPGSRHVVTRFGAEFDVPETQKLEAVATYEPPEAVLERRGAEWLEQFLAQRRLSR